ARTDRADREHRIDEDHVGTQLARERVDVARERRRRQQERLLRAHDAVRLLGVEGRVTVVRRRQHGRVRGRQPPPQLAQVRLDAAELGREVVRDEQRGQGVERGVATRQTSLPSSTRERPARTERSTATRRSSYVSRYGE